jgi:hypothetical protein
MTANLHRIFDNTPSVWNDIIDVETVAYDNLATKRMNLFALDNEAQSKHAHNIMANPTPFPLIPNKKPENEVVENKKQKKHKTSTKELLPEDENIKPKPRKSRRVVKVRDSEDSNRVTGQPSL